MIKRFIELLFNSLVHGDGFKTHYGEVRMNSTVLIVLMSILSDELVKLKDVVFNLIRVIL